LLKGPDKLVINFKKNYSLKIVPENKELCSKIINSQVIIIQKGFKSNHLNSDTAHDALPTYYLLRTDSFVRFGKEIRWDSSAHPFFPPFFMAM